MSKDWSELVANPESFGGSEKALWLKLEPILHELLEELKKNGKIETVYVATELDGLHAVIETMKDLGNNYNLLLHISDDYAKNAKFMESVRPFGFDGRDRAGVLIHPS